MTETDSSALWVLRDSLQEKNMEVARLTMDLMRRREEMVNLQREQLRIERDYDTAAPVDSASGRPPVRREVITISNSRTEKVTASAEQLHGDELGLQQHITRAQRSLQSAAEKQTHEEVERKEKASPSSSPFYLKLLPFGIILVILMMLWYFIRRK